MSPGGSLSIPVDAHFQFRATGDCALRILIVTMPPWPGEDEAYRVAGRWPVSATRVVRAYGVAETGRDRSGFR